MKRGYKRLLIFEISIMIILFLNSFVSSILSSNLKIIFLALILLLFRFLFGFEKDRHRHAKSVCLEIIIYLLIYFILYYLSGLLTGFAMSTRFTTIEGLVKVVLPVIIMIPLQEVLRYMMLSKSEGSKLLVVMTCILFIIFDLVGTYDSDTFSGAYPAFLFIATYLLPSISRNIFCSYVSMKSGYKPTILYLMIIRTYSFFVPIIPNPNVYLYSIFELITPAIFMYYIYKFFKKKQDEEVLRRKQKNKAIALVLPTLLVVFLVYITSGYFHYHAIAVASGSMTPAILKGDVVVIEKTDGHFDDVKEGQVIAYKKDKIIVVHRLYKKIKVGNEYFFYSKGDANDFVDNYKITEEMMIGVVNVRVPFVGYPTVWLNNL